MPLKKSKNLQKLDLSSIIYLFNKFEDDDMVKISSLLRYLPKLKEINLSCIISNLYGIVLQQKD